MYPQRERLEMVDLEQGPQSHVEVVRRAVVETPTPIAALALYSVSMRLAALAI